MVLEHWLFTRDEAALRRYLPILSLSLDFFAHHYPNRTAGGQLVLWPTQAIETYWCASEVNKTTGEWTPPYFRGEVGDPAAESNCIVNDTPTVAIVAVPRGRSNRAAHRPVAGGALLLTDPIHAAPPQVLLERALRLPATVTTPAQRAQWSALQKIWPPLPLVHEKGYLTLAPYASYPVNSALHNSEVSTGHDETPV